MSIGIFNMTLNPSSIREVVNVRAHPTVVRLQDLEKDNARWLSDSFLITPEIKNHLQILKRVFRQKSGGGIFLIGHYGSGKSHFLAYLTQQLRDSSLLPAPPAVVPLSLVNFSAANRLEDILSQALDIHNVTGDRRPAWEAMLHRHPRGLLLVVDELSEFLRAKSDTHAFTEDVRFLQYLGEWVQDRPCWIIAALQEGIEHTGELEYDLYRKIKDRYPLRLLLTPTHVKNLIADSILVKKPEYHGTVENLLRELKETYPGSALDFDALRTIYPLHPVTLELLEEVRDRFSQARGVVDFTVTRLQGDHARGITPFLDQPFGNMLTADIIIDHFRDLFELQSEFLPLAQQFFPWYQKHLDELFERPALQDLAQRLLKLLVLIHLSPAREQLSAAEAVNWLMFNAARVEPERNRKIIDRVLSTLAERGRYVSAHSGRYRLNLRDDGAAALDRLLKREVASLQGQDAMVFEALLPLLSNSRFNPLALPRDQWQHRQVQWQFHPRHYAVWLGQQTPTPVEGIGLCIRLPWHRSGPMPGGYTLQPAPIELTADLIELAALTRLRERPGDPELARRIGQRIESGGRRFAQLLRSAWQEARWIPPEGDSEPAPRLDGKTTLDSWLNNLALWILRRRYPAFERFAPRHGPLPKEIWLRFMRFAGHHDIGSAEADDHVKLIREAYLVPMGLLRRKGRKYHTPVHLERHELVRLITPLLEHNPSPQTVHEHLYEPIYGLVPDQVNLLLVFLLLQGEIDILKGRKSYRDSFETLPNPLHYDRVSPRHGLGMENINALQRLCQGLNLRIPSQWTVLLQRRCADRLIELRRKHLDRLHPLLRQVQELEQGQRLAERIQHYINRWNALDKGEHQLQGLEQFLFEISPVDAFLEEFREFEGLPEHLQRLLKETQRYLQLLQHPTVRQLLDDDAGSLDADELPGLDEPQALEDWLQRATQCYEGYKQHYRQRHERWWQNLSEHPLWSWQPPALSHSHHLGLNETLTELKSCRHEAMNRRCHGLVNLDYQPLCSCGFDGETAPIESQLQRLDELKTSIETGLRLFFQQEEIKSRMRDWQREGMEMNTATISYLEGRRPAPEVQDVESLDQYLSGIALATEMALEPIIDLLCQRTWKPSELMGELQRRFTGSGKNRLHFTGRDQGNIPASVTEWCVKQSLKQGIALPKAMRHRDLKTITKILRPEWVTPKALHHLEDLGLEPHAIQRILSWILDGHIPLPETKGPEDSLLDAVSTMMQPPSVHTPLQLARYGNQLYRAHDRLRQLAPKRWLDLLEGLANVPLEGLPLLPELLSKHPQTQWLIIDALGLALLDPLQTVLLKCFPEWSLEQPRFAQRPSTTTTDGCYRELLEADINHPFEKINVVDELLHKGMQPFADITTLTQTQLAIACRRLRSRFDPQRALLIFADHGFRIATDGRSYTHGSTSTMEQVVPVWHLVPKKPV
ncbi:MAG: hypothetical protein GY807_01770 [Gammaproteobacteria bacterium]|nr:hypothetical protein [Gammaproteobacteria bacterium]